MTIERQWLEIMKEEVPDAFTDDPPFEPEAGFVDAQIKLMSMPHENTWEIFLLKQFRAPVMNLFSMGAQTVVLAFDDYALVPRAKAITQAKRREKLEPFEFSEDQLLPEEPPVPWNAAMANRTFKAKVVGYVCDSMALLLYDMPRGRTVVVDWRGEYQDEWSMGPLGLVVERHPRMQVGEADIKFARWSKHLGVPLAAEAIDGDFVPIAMASGSPGLMIMRYKVLRDATDSSRCYEWVNVDVLKEGMRRAFAQTRCQALATWSNWEIHCLLALIALTGTDYSRGFPLVGPKKVWSMLPQLLPILTCDCMRIREDAKYVLDPYTTASLLYAEVYVQAFSNHAKNAGRDVFQVLKGSKLSARTKSSLPSRERALCTAKNANFVMEYWLGNDPDSMDGTYGFAERGGVVQWDE